jgi:hypothetical protein
MDRYGRTPQMKLLPFLLLLGAVGTIAGAYLIADATSNGRERTLAFEAQQRELKEAEFKRGMHERIEKVSAWRAEERQAALEIEAEKAALEADAKRMDQAESDRVLAEIWKDVTEKALSLDLEVVENRQDGLIVREPFVGETLWFTPHTKATRSLPTGRVFKAKGYKSDATYRTNGWTVLEVISLVP